ILTNSPALSTIQFGIQHTRAKKLRQAGLDEHRAWQSASNGHGPWWNAGASHMNAALPKRYFAAHGLVSLLTRHRRWRMAS
ncbi:MAG: hypothetical protein OXJ90_28545, partial [Spirochaetaceae bacterium]|nr:hypothetical protein [Spirochaetaceae bacterium]